MALTDTEGIITKETKYGDTSRILTVITKDLGKISVLAKSVRRGKSGLAAATSLFSYSRFTLFKSGSSSLYKLNECEQISSFSQLRESLEGMAFAAYLCDVTNSVVQEGAPDLEQTELLLRSLYMLCREESNPEKVKAVFEFRTLALSGLMPDISVCGDCGATSPLCTLDAAIGAVYCDKCSNNHNGTMQINDSILAAISYIILCDDKKIFSFNMSQPAIRYLSTLGEHCIGILLDKSFKTLDYLRRVTALT